ncbi:MULTISPECIES: biotin--[acetyl-CoA-carboxylase] ligase [unclassified Streptomyces]|uniref:biotin--[acetyl-CoA-carboxylase] ligase n=1 Tax=unclassified Streptomyces TaxID=2593676 RepID=UPI00136D813F|nr:MULTISPECIES: biotin--[acetyl-CoA-carboxylase] ligase [unclassified Streptomyces]NDZ99535.1 biotin--[acetyl-CoA-carboxylase] ligase [Streptomyces sp. SID10116]MYY82092.1 biotin--[acetyl-CoA-carboxylase] ligase [Streptomyces sp. SID335]MYZ17450.1 biotin--[acetyl-CoA-carboxylase] ligase [Streptomyces sp. SID337]NDZ89026.1 biotin--[acetyl-CoA-carboxylase] ligase [Streptomyces sp. SID10115]NEB45156.1 biotin--[acetyl-CoA-carboxylase] ligase [Streptomyces sp. SID339]
MTPSDAEDNRWSDLDRPPLNAASLRRTLLRDGGLWSSLDVVPVTGSTNSDLAARADELPEGAVLVAEEQSAARGRLDRRWSAPARSGLFFSVLLKPAEVPVERWGWLPLLTGVAVATGLSRVAGVDTALKWPNDLLVTVGDQERKAGGILAERAGSASGGGIVIGIGLNVTLREDELPVPTAGSLALAGAKVTDRDPLLRSVLRSLEHWYTSWRDADGDPTASRLQETYAAGCATLGRRVRAELPGNRAVAGEAVAVDADGRLILATQEGVQEPVGAGDIVHLRPATP